MSIYKDIAKAPCLTDLLDARDRMELEIGKFYEAFATAEQVSKTLGRFGYMPASARPQGSRESAMAEVDAAFWRKAYDLTGLSSLMDATARREFDRSLETRYASNGPPAFTLDNVRSQFVTAVQDAEMMFQRGVYEIFRHIHSWQGKGYATNRGESFRIGPKVILCSWASFDTWSKFPSPNSSRYDDYNDLDRVLSVLDGKPFSPRTFETACRQAWEKGEDFEGDYVRMRAYKNGNVSCLVSSVPICSTK